MKRPLPLKASQLPTKKGRNEGIDRDHLLQLLHKHFGHAAFRGLQLEAIETVLSGRDCFCLMPTGAGKSLCYEIPAVARSGIVLVISPLIALMENQVAALKGHHVPAEYLSSTQTAKIKSQIYESLESGKPSLKLLYITPESLLTDSFLTKLKAVYGRGLLSLVAIDEAHCISSWGHDFRPSYRKLSIIRKHLPGVPILALTATAAKKVQEDVVKSLDLHQPSILVSSFNRRNIFYEVRYKDILKNGYDDLRELLKSAPDECAIIYCHSRATCDEIGLRLLNDGLSTRVYHAGLSDKVRSKSLNEWVSGKVLVIVATVAFGMGIDRKDVRMVCHYNLPKSIEGFYQESGRAGRDQKASRSVLYYGLDDKKNMEYFIKCSSKKNQKRDSGELMLKRNLEAFSKVVSLCEGEGCRRQRLLLHFGEQVSPSLCARTCDACRWPQRLEQKLKELAEVSSTKQGLWTSVYINSNSNKNDWRDLESEFWNHEDDEAVESEEEISSSDDEAKDLAATVVSKKKGLSKRMDALIQAEECCKAKERQKQKGDEKKTVAQDLRDAAVCRLKSNVEQALQRLQNNAHNASDAAKALEAECYNKYGKLGRSFYNSQVASTVRWLSTCRQEDLKARISSNS